MKRLIFLCLGFLCFIPVQLEARKYFCEIKGTSKTLSAGLKIVFPVKKYLTRNNPYQQARLHQKFPYYIVDFYTDILEISHMISGADCYLEIDSSGQVVYPKTAQMFVPDSRLNGYLASSMPATIQAGQHRIWKPSARSV